MTKQSEIKLFSKLPIGLVPSVGYTAFAGLVSIAAAGAAEKPPTNDIKPTLSSVPKADIDAEQMRLVKATHKRIMERQAKEKGEFKPYTDKMKAGMEISMQPIKTKPFVWKGADEGDELKVTLDDFWMATTETTWEVYDEFYNTELRRERDGRVDDNIRPSVKEDLILLARPTPQYYPVTYNMEKQGHSAVGLTHHAANKFCQWLSHQTGHFYRLPTEAEWEFACRGGSDKKFSWGDDPKLSSEYAWFGIKKSEAYDETPYYKPAKKKANGYGLYDMHGNVLELTLDGFVKNRQKHFGKKSVHNPWVKGTQPYPHVTKGGYWMDTLENIVASARTPTEPKWKITDPQDPKSVWALSDAPFLGFRVVRPLKVPTPEEMYHYWNSGTAYDGEMAVYE